MSYGEYNNTTNFGDEDDDYTEKIIEEYNFKECTIYAVDCRPSMFEQDEYGQIPVATALKSIRSKLVDTIKSRPNDQYAIVLFGTKEKKNMPNRDHIYVLQTLDIPDAPRIKELDSLIEDISQVKDQYGSTDKLFPISDLFWVCSDIKSSAPKLSTIRVILITDNDDPTNNLPDHRKPAIQRAKDLTTVGVEIILFGLNRPDQPFDKDLFYKDIVTFDETNDDDDEFNTKVLSCTGRLDELFDKIKTFQTTTRSEFRLPFQIAPNLTIGIRGYNMIIEKKITAPKLFCSSDEQLKEVKSTTRWRCVDTDQILLPIDIKNSFLYGGEYVVFTKAELEELKTVNSPGLLVLGFRETRALKAYHQVSHPYFIYPDESQYKQSKSVFFLLLNTLLKKNRMAICSFVRKSNSVPKIVALLPHVEKLDKEGNQVDPPGFQLIILPYAEDIRNIPPYNVAEDYESGCEVAKAIIEKFKIKDGYNPMAYSNPHLQHQNNMIQSIALESQNDTEKVVDNTIPNYQFIESELAEDVETFKKIVGLDTVAVEDILENNAKRRATSSNSTEEANKRPKLNEMTIEEHWKTDSLNRVTNPSLKEYLTSVGLHPKKLKADLITQVDAYLRTKLET